MERRFGLTVLLLSASAAFFSAPFVRAEKADRIFINGTIWTGEPARPRREALAVRDSRILAVGTTDEIRRLAEKHTEVVDLKGRFVIPGFHDAHLHFMSGCLSLASVDLRDAWTVEEVQRRITEFAQAHRDRPWVVGRGWSYGAFPGGLPHKKWLDAAVPDRPAWIVSYDGHTGWCNSAALKEAVITRASRDPQGGVIVRDDDGDPSGVLKEVAMDLVDSLVPKPDQETRYQALKKGLDLAASYGLTSVQDVSIDLVDLPNFDRALRDRVLTVRVRCARPMKANAAAEDVERLQELKARYASSHFHLGAVQALIDGVVESRTAAMLEPYVGGGQSEPLWTDEALRSAVALYDREGFQILLHAIGDRAVRMSLDAFEAAVRANGPSRRRHRIEHVEVPQLAEIARFKPLGVIASTQALFANPDRNTLGVFAAALGPERVARALPFKLLDDAGAVQAFGSDWPACSLDPLKGIYCAVARMTPDGVPAGGWQPQQCLTVEAALRHFTADAAYAGFAEGFSGTLVPGKWADFTVLSGDILTIPAERILKTRVMLTVMGGNNTYRAKDF